MIPITKVRFGADEEKLVLEVLRSGHLAQGPMVERFESIFASLHGVRHAVAVNNGTTALVATLQSLDIGPGDEVITTPFTFVATLNAILEAGATVRFADIGHDYNIDPASIEQLVNERTKAIMPVHLYGYMCDMGAIMSIADQHGLQVVEDAAQAVGAECNGRKAGSFGVGCFSLYATKNITTGEGGVVTTNDDEIADRLRLLRNQGMRRRYEYEVAGHNYRMTDLAAAVGIPQLDRLAEVNAARHRNAAQLIDGLGDIEGFELPPTPEDGRTHVYHQFTVRIAQDAPISRDTFVQALNDQGVGCGIYYPRLVGDYDCYREDERVVPDPTPAAAETAREVCSLPVHPHLTPSEVGTIVKTVRQVLTS